MQRWCQPLPVLALWAFGQTEQHCLGRLWLCAVPPWMTPQQQCAPPLLRRLGSWLRLPSLMRHRWALLCLQALVDCRALLVWGALTALTGLLRHAAVNDVGHIEYPQVNATPFNT